MTSWRRGLSIVAAAATVVVGLQSGSAAASESDGSLVRVDDGWLRGTVIEGYRSFQGIPYAAPPVRWQMPRPAAPWHGVRDATAPGQRCAQYDPRNSRVEGGEDCLFLNVTTPRTTTGRLPVLVFVHGGGLVTGFGAAYDARRMVEQDAIVVTPNYRLGALGFLKHPSLRHPYAGNFGLADQQEALRWVRHNIAAFGGDPGNVTLWGQSGGGVSVCAQLASPGARGLFDKAIVMSASCANDMLDRQTAISRGLNFAAEVGCSTAQCLREAPVERLIRPADNQETFKVHRYAAQKPWMPVAETPALPWQPLTALRKGIAVDVPLIHGGTKDEMFAHVGLTHNPPVSATDYPNIVLDIFGPDTGRILATYPVDDYPVPGAALARLLTDYGKMVGACNQLPAINAAAHGAPVFAYEYAQASDIAFSNLPPGAHHGSDLENLIDRVPPVFTPERKAFADRLIGLWTTFARTGDPGPGWPAYRHGTSTVLSLAIDRTGPVDLAREHHCGFWRSVP